MPNQSAMNSRPDLIDVYSDIRSLAAAAARRFLQLSLEAMARRGYFTVALSGGSTPKILYALLAADPSLRSAFPWAKTHFFFGDERHVPPDNSESNFHMASEAMFNPLAGETLNIHRIRGELSHATDAAADYEADLQEFFSKHNELENGLPRFDLIFLGMGPDGHTASLFPGTAALQETDRWVVANWVEKFKTDRITFTYPVLNNADETILLVSGAEKAPVMTEILGSPPARVPHYPVEFVRPRNGVKRWMLDRAAVPFLPVNQI
jgi:6-phosphogluconolactonase